MTNLKQDEIGKSLIMLVNVRYLIDDGYHNKELCEYVDSIIGEKKSSKSARFSKLKYLPSNGLKGFFYYKLTEAEQKGINVSINISKQIENSFINNMNTKDFN